MYFFGHKFPYTNFHDLNLDWIVGILKLAVMSVNGYTPDENGNVQLPTVPTVSSVNGQQGEVVLDAEDVGAIPDSVTVPTKTSQLENDSGYITAAQAGAVTSVNGEIGAVVLDATDVGAAATVNGVSPDVNGNVELSPDVLGTEYAPGESLNLNELQAPCVISNAQNTTSVFIILPKKLPANMTITQQITVEWVRANGQATTATAGTVTRVTENLLNIPITTATNLSANHAGMVRFVTLILTFRLIEDI